MNKKVVTSTENKNMEIGKGHPSTTSYFAKSFLNDFGRLQESMRASAFTDNSEMLYSNMPPILFDDYSGDHSGPNGDYKFKVNGSDLQYPRGLISRFSNPAVSNHVCRVCAKTFRASSLLDIHMRVHVGAKPFVCPMCGHRATQKGNLKLHMKKHHGADLPPHIDLVPDSGIWGHPQENALCSSTAQITEEIDMNDTSGKRKQVAQAVSSLLNEEIVELIKKCQNNVGQGMTGRITESLEDFIRIAKRKADNGVDNSSENVMIDNENNLSTQRKKRQLNSLRFKPYSNESGSSNKNTYNIMKKEKTNIIKCLLCGKFIDIHANTTLGLPICDLCTHLHREASRKPKSSETLLKLDSNKEIKYGFEDNEDVTINSVSLVDCSNDKLRLKEKACGKCNAVFISAVDLEKHAQRYHRPRSQPAPTTDKENFLKYIGLIPKCSSEISIDEALKREESLNPIINCILSQKSHDDINTEVSCYTGKIQLPFANSKTNFATSRKRFTGSRNKVELGTQKRASPGVLSMLRQAVLNSVEHKMVSNATQEKRTLIRENDNVYTREEYASEVSQAKLQTPFRNPAMLSLAEIGKTALDDSETEDEIANEYRDSNLDNEKYFDTNVCRLNGDFQSVLMDLQEQENGGYRCQFCPKRFKYRSVLEIHIRSHTGERPYKCPYCEYAGTQHNCLKLHVQRHHPKEYARNHSDVVNKSNCLSPSPSQLPGAEPIPNRMSCFSPVECPVCGRVSPSPGYLKIHMRSHKKSLDHVCHVCGRGFKEYWYLTTHLKTHERELGSMKYNMQQNKPTPFELLAKSALSKSAENIKLLQNNVLVNSQFSTSSNHNLLALHKPVHEKLLNKHDFYVNSLFTNTKKLTDAETAVTSNGVSSTSLIKSEACCEPSDYVESRNPVIKRENETENVTKRVVKSTTHSSRRKAFCPSRISSDPYPSVISTNYHSNLGSQKTTDSSSERRRSRPRKIQHGSYLLPPSSNVSSNTSGIENNVDTRQVCPVEEIDEDMPLDLSCSTGKWNYEQDRNNNEIEKPLNLSK